MMVMTEVVLKLVLLKLRVRIAGSFQADLSHKRIDARHRSGPRPST